MISAIVSRPFETTPLDSIPKASTGRKVGGEDTRITYAVRASDTLVVNGQGIAFLDGRRRGGRSRSDLATCTVMKQRANVT